MKNFDARCWTEPWANDERFKGLLGKVYPYTVTAPTKLWVLWQMAQQSKRLDGEVWECGTYKGGSAAVICEAVRDRQPLVRLFDTFCGIPYFDDRDNHHKAGDFSDVDVRCVTELVAYPKLDVRAGVVPDTFRGLESVRIGFCHIDVDVYSSVKACCEFVWPRLIPGGIVVFDDYSTRTCAGARMATDEFFEEKPEKPVQHFGGGAVVFKNAV